MTKTKATPEEKLAHEGTKRGWVVNEAKDCPDSLIGRSGKNLVRGDAWETVAHSSIELRDLGVIGIWDVDAMRISR